MIYLTVDTALRSWVAHGAGRKFVAPDLMSTFADMMCPAGAVTGASIGGAHNGTLQRLFSNTRVTREPEGVIIHPPKLGSSLVPAVNCTLNLAYRRTARYNCILCTS
jgi:hypothetical protein